MTVYLLVKCPWWCFYVGMTTRAINTAGFSLNPWRLIYPGLTNKSLDQPLKQPSVTHTHKRTQKGGSGGQSSDTGGFSAATVVTCDKLKVAPLQILRKSTIFFFFPVVEREPGQTVWLTALYHTEVFLRNDDIKPRLIYSRGSRVQQQFMLAVVLF